MLIFFGTRSPLVVDYEETCLRLDLRIAAAIHIKGHSRLIFRYNSLEIADINSQDFDKNYGCVTPAFSSARRQELSELAHQKSIKLAPALIDPTAIIAKSARIGNGTYINAGAIVGGAALIGKNCLINRAASIGHHSILADYVTIAPGVTITSSAKILEHAMIGAGAIILPGIKIGKNAIIAAGSVVTKNVADDEFVAGNPAKSRRINRKASSLNTGDEE